MDNKQKLYIIRGIAVLLVLAGLFTLIRNYYSISPEDRDTDNLKKLTSAIIEKNAREEVDPGKPEIKKIIYEITVQYQFGGTGQKFSKAKAVDKDFYEKLFQGDSLVIYAKQDNPYHIVIPDSRSTPVSFFNKNLLIALALILAGVGVWYYASFLEKQKAI